METSLRSLVPADFLNIGAEQSVIFDVPQSLRIALPRRVIAHWLSVNDERYDPVPAPQRDKIQDLLIDPGRGGAGRRAEYDQKPGVAQILLERILQPRSGQIRLVPEDAEFLAARPLTAHIGGDRKSLEFSLQPFPKGKIAMTVADKGIKSIFVHKAPFSRKYCSECFLFSV